MKNIIKQTSTHPTKGKPVSPHSEPSASATKFFASITPTGQCFYSGRGRILRIKTGYNPNSSSIGSVVFLFSTSILEITALFGAVSALIFSHFVKNPNQQRPSDVAQKSKPREV